MNILKIKNISDGLLCDYISSMKIKYTWVSFSDHHSYENEHLMNKIIYAKNVLSFSLPIYKFTIAKMSDNGFSTYYIVDDVMEQFSKKIEKLKMLKAFL